MLGNVIVETSAQLDPTRKRLVKHRRLPSWQSALKNCGRCLLAGAFWVPSGWRERCTVWQRVFPLLYAPRLKRVGGLPCVIPRVLDLRFNWPWSVIQLYSVPLTFVIIPHYDSTSTVELRHVGEPCQNNVRAVLKYQ